MRQFRRAAIVGAGSRRCASSVLFSLFNLNLSLGARVSLYDPHLEAVDLYERLARTLEHESGHSCTVIRAETIEGCLREADLIVLCFGLGGHRDVFEKATSLRGEAVEREGLRDKARAIALTPIFEVINECVYSLTTAPVTVNLVRPVKLTGQLLATDAVHLDWPKEATLDEKISNAHRALRWIRSDEYAQLELPRQKSGPMIEAVEAWDSRKENLFNAKAVSGWVSELEQYLPELASILDLRWLAR